MLLRDYLHQNNIPAKTFASLVGISASYVSLLKEGKASPSLLVLLRIKKATKGAVSSLEDWAEAEEGSKTAKLTLKEAATVERMSRPPLRINLTLAELFQFRSYDYSPKGFAKKIGIPLTELRAYENASRLPIYNLREVIKQASGGLVTDWDRAIRLEALRKARAKAPANLIQKQNK